MASNIRRVCLFLDSVYPVVDGGGAEKQVEILGRAFQERGIEVSIVAPLLPYGSQVTSENDNGILVHRIPYPKVRIVGSIILYTRVFLFSLKICRSVDVCHVHIGKNMATVCTLAARIVGIPVYIKFTGQTELQYGVLSVGKKYSLANICKRICMKLASGYQATSTEIAATAAEIGFETSKIFRIPNAVDTHRFHQQLSSADREKLRNELAVQDEIIFLCVARLVRDKGVDKLLQACRMLIEHGQQWRLLIVGDGMYRSKLEQMTDKMGLLENVSFLGHKDEVYSYLQIAHCGVLPSLYEGLSNTLLEYLASGLPVIASNVSGTADFVQPEVNGWIYDPEDVETLTHLLTDFLNLKSSQRQIMGNNARSRVSELAPIDKTCDRLLEMYESSF